MIRLTVALAMLLGIAGAATPQVDSYEAARMALIETIETDVRATSAALGRDRLAPEVIAALRAVPRHEFVERRLQDQAYDNRPLPIGHGQTISQPYIVAIMTELLEPRAGQRVLEIGTGSGYQAAVLAELVDRVYSIEIIEALGVRAKRRLRRLGYDNVEVRIADGYHGWPDQAPFDGIIVTAAGDHVPAPLIEQLKPGGRMVLPVGGWYFTQQLLLIQKRADGRIETRDILPVAFVPLTGDH